MSDCLRSNVNNMQTERQKKKKRSEECRAVETEAFSRLAPETENPDFTSQTQSGGGQAHAGICADVFTEAHLDQFNTTDQ